MQQLYSSMVQLQKYMKIKLALNNHQTQIRIRSKHRSNKKRQTTQMHSNERSYASPLISSSPTNSRLKAVQPNKSSKDVKSKCQHKHKGKAQKEQENEYYKTTSFACWERERDKLIEENAKLKRQNKVLNEYFHYIESKENMLSSNVKLYSFKQIQSNMKESQFANNSKIEKTAITKASSKMSYLQDSY